MKVTFRGIFVDATTKEVKPGEIAQTLLIERPERRDDFGEVVQKSQFFEVGTYVKDAEKNQDKLFLPADWKGKKVEVTAWLNSNQSVKDGKTSHFLNLNFRDIKIIP